MGYIILLSNNAYLYIFDLDMNLETHVIHFTSCSPALLEPSDVLALGNQYYVTDFKQHCVVVLDSLG